MLTSQQKRGKAGEDAVAAYLLERGWELVERNWHCRQGEIDLIARRGEVLAFVEVKTRAAGSGYQPFEAVDAAKQRKIIRAAEQYLLQTNEELQPRFDAAAVQIEQDGSLRVEYLEDAFDGSEVEF